MFEKNFQDWWIPLIRGIMAILFGVVAIMFPGEAFTALVWIFGVYALVDGGVTVYNALTKQVNNRLWQLIEGIAAILAGVFAFGWTGLTGLTIVFLIGLWAIFTGAMQIMAAWELRETIDNEIWLGLAGLFSVLMGILFLFNPLGGALATIWLIGIYSIAFGVMFILLAFRLREMDEKPKNEDTLSNPSSAPTA